MRAAIFSTYPPRECGIATFSFDVRSVLLDVPGINDVSPVVVADDRSTPQRSEVLATVLQSDRNDYVRAASLLGGLDIDVVLLQHEFGIFGGLDGEYVLAFAQELTQPLVVTLHTVLSQPSSRQLRVLTALCDQAERVIVMTDTARRLVLDAGASAAAKIRVVPHGAPIELGRRHDDLAACRDSLNLAPAAYPGSESRLLLSTFGLLSPGKGLETAIEALPLIVERHPKARYLLAGRTHPQVARREGEQYRLMLERLVADLDLGSHVEFDDRFLSIGELADLLAATDVFLTPFRNREQIASGSLTFALAAGCAAVSTPYWYAEDMLASGAGQIVPFDDPRALAEAVCELVEQPDRLANARAEARRIGSQLTWPSVASVTAAVLREAATHAQPRTRFRPIVVSRARIDNDVSGSPASGAQEVGVSRSGSTRNQTRRPVRPVREPRRQAR